MQTQKIVLCTQWIIRMHIIKPNYLKYLHHIYIFIKTLGSGSWIRYKRLLNLIKYQFCLVNALADKSRIYIMNHGKSKHLWPYNIHPFYHHANILKQDIPNLYYQDAIYDILICITNMQIGIILYCIVDLAA